MNRKYIGCLALFSALYGDIAIAQNIEKCEGFHDTKIAITDKSYEELVKDVENGKISADDAIARSNNYFNQMSRLSPFQYSFHAFYEDLGMFERLNYYKITKDCSKTSFEEKKKEWTAQVDSYRTAAIEKINIAAQTGERIKQAKAIEARKEQDEKSKVKMCKQSSDYKISMLAKQIFSEKENISIQEKIIANERKVGQVSGFVNKQTMYEAGQKIQQGEARIEYLSNEYKQLGGRPAEMDKLRAEKTPCAHLVPCEQKHTDYDSILLCEAGVGWAQ